MLIKSIQTRLHANLPRIHLSFSSIVKSLASARLFYSDIINCFKIIIHLIDSYQLQLLACEDCLHCEAFQPAHR